MRCGALRGGAERDAALQCEAMRCGARRYGASRCVAQRSDVRHHTVRTRWRKFYEKFLKNLAADRHTPSNSHTPRAPGPRGHTPHPPTRAKRQRTRNERNAQRPSVYETERASAPSLCALTCFVIRALPLGIAGESHAPLTTPQRPHLCCAALIEPHARELARVTPAKVTPQRTFYERN